MSTTISSFSSTLPDLLCTLWVISLAKVFVGEVSPELRLLDVALMSPLISVLLMLLLFFGEGMGVGGVAVEGLSFLSNASTATAVVSACDPSSITVALYVGEIGLHL